MKEQVGRRAPRLFLLAVHLTDINRIWYTITI